MKKLLRKIVLLNLISFFALTSCVKNEVTNLNLDKSSISINIGQSDTLNVTITSTGDINTQPLSWTSSNNDVVTFIEDNSSGTSVSESNTISKKFIVTALRTGTTIVTLRAGEKTVSCEVIVGQRNLSFTQVFASNYGDYYDIEKNSFDMYLLENTLSVDDSGKLVGTGTILYLDFIVPLSYNTIPNEQFYMSNEGGDNTFFSGEAIESDGETYLIGSRIETFTETEATVWLIKDGQYTVTSDGNNFHIDGDLITADNEVIHFSYDGAIAVADKKEVPVQLHPDFTKGRLIYFGDAYTTGLSNNFLVDLVTQGVNFEDSVLNGEILSIEFNAPLTVKDSIPSGTYNMLPRDIETNDIVPYSLVFGYTTDDGYNWGTWYYSTETTKKFKTGSMKVTKTDDQYKIQYAFFDRFGSEVSGEYNGPLSYIDATQEASSNVSAAKIKRKDTLHKSVSNKFEKRMNRVKTFRFRR